jgi:hypothetical protein
MARRFIMSNFYLDLIKPSRHFETTECYSGLDLLFPPFRKSVEAILVDAEAAGHKMMVFETYRSQARQEQLFADGKSELKTVGVHHYGLAADIVFVVNGQPNWDGDFALLRDLADKHGLISGVDWGSPGVHHSFVDSDHVQLVHIDQQPALFAGTWYPSEVA